MRRGISFSLQMHPTTKDTTEQFSQLRITSKHKASLEQLLLFTWKHVSDCYEKDWVGQVRKLPKLTNEHISLNSYTVMRVNLAAQVMSSSVS